MGRQHRGTVAVSCRATVSLARRTRRKTADEDRTCRNIESCPGRSTPEWSNNGDSLLTSPTMCVKRGRSFLLAFCHRPEAVRASGKVEIMRIAESKLEAPGSSRISLRPQVGLSLVPAREELDSDPVRRKRAMCFSPKSWRARSWLWARQRSVILSIECECVHSQTSA